MGCGAPLDASAGAREQRKTVTVVFCDVVGSTALGETRDPEVVRAVLARYFERMRGILEAHGGTVEKFIGDAVVAVFGVPVAHEDDALRALRAASEMRDALPELGLEARVGVNTGEIVTSGHGTLVTGDAVNVAARLQQAAGSGEVLVGAQTRALARGAVDVEELEPLVLKGKAEPVAAFRLLAVGEAPERAHGVRFVGRGRELALLREAWMRAVEGDRCELMTVTGEPGVGKSRLVAEFVAALGVRVVVGRCLSYGEGITYFPVVEVLKQLDAVSADAVTATLGSLLGESDAVTSPDEIAWAFRKRLEQASPLVVVFDDIQWGEETFLDLVEQVTLLATAPLLVVCLARPELGERRPLWPVALRLEPLPPADVEDLLPAGVSAGLRERIARAAGGNPLFVTEMVAMAADEGGEVLVPPTLKALLAARLDRLEAAERDVLERGAVEGELFHRGAVQALAPSEAQVAPRLMALVRKELIRPDRPLLPAEDGFRFCHLLIRDAAYDALPKATRAELHERFADWLDHHGAALVERDELVGYHLQQAYHFRTELGDTDGKAGTLGERAAAHLSVAALRAETRADFHAVANLLERALALGISDPSERARVQIGFGYALYEIGRRAESAVILAACIDTATSLGEQGLATRALVQLSTQRAVSEPQLDPAEMLAVAEQAVEIFAALADSSGLARAERLAALALNRQGRNRESLAAAERALLHAEGSGDQDTRRRVVGTIAFHIKNGPTPALEAIRRCEELVETSRDDRVLEATITLHLSELLAMAGRFDEAREHLGKSGLVLDELNQTTVSVHQQTAAATRNLIGDLAGAEQEWTAIWLRLRAATGGAAGMHTQAISVALQLANFYCDDGRWDDAEGCLSYGRDLPEQTFYTPQRALRLVVEARVAAFRGQHTEALRLAQRAVELAEPTDHSETKAQTWLALAEVQRARGETAQAAAAVAAALDLYEQKGNVAAAARLRAAAHE